LTGVSFLKTNMKMETDYNREKRDIEEVKADRSGGDVFYRLPERRKTEAVSLAAVTVSGSSLEYVPNEVKNREICRAALNSKDADCSILWHIPFADVQKEGVQKFVSSGIPAFVAYSFVDIRDAKTAHDAVKADAYCLQFVPDKLMTGELCKTALQSPDTDKKILGFIPEKFRDTVPSNEKTPNPTGRDKGHKFKTSV
jgi:hypothetical protein